MDRIGPSLFSRLGTLADPVRGRLLFLLDRHELTVTELTAVLQLPQSTVSRHLRVLADDGWLTARVDGTSHLYRLASGQLEAGARRLWHLLREQMTGTMAVAADAQRLSGVLAERRTRSQDFFSRAAGQWDSLRAELFGGRPDLGPRSPSSTRSGWWEISAAGPVNWPPPSLPSCAA